MARLRTTELIARDAELEELRAAVEAARGGNPAAVLVCGPAGVGKSRLVEEAVGRFCGNRDLLLVGHCVDLYGEQTPYAPFADALRHLVRTLGTAAARQILGTAAHPLAALVPDLAEQAQRESLAPTGMKRSGGELLDAFVTALDRVGRGTGRVVWLWLEDLQWADRATRILLAYLLRVHGPSNLVVTATARTSEVSTTDERELLGDLLRLPRVDQLLVEPFTRGQVAAHLRALIGTRPTGPLVQAVTALGGGLPFYTELLAADGLEGPGVSSAVRSIVRAEVDRLDLDARTTVQAASVEASKIPHDVLVAVAGSDVDVLAGIAGAVAASVLVPTRDGGGYQFRHALLRESVEAALLPAERSRWHARWAERFEVDAAIDPFAQIAAAHHWAGAGDRTRAFEAALEGAALANRLLAVSEEVRLLAKALVLWSAVPDAERRAGTDHDTLLRYTLVAALNSRVDATGPLSDLRSESGRNKVRDVFANWIQSYFDDKPWRPTASDVTVLLQEPLSNAWLTRTAAEASMALHETDPARALRLAERAAAAGERAAQRFRQMPRERHIPAITPELELLWAERCRAEAWFLVEGRAEEMVGFYCGIRPRCAAVSLETVLECDSAILEPLAALGRHREVSETAILALAALPQPPQDRWLFMDLVCGAADADIALGDWDSARARLEQACAELGDDFLVVWPATLAGLVCCWRGSVDEARRHAVTARGFLDAAGTDSGRLTWETAWLEAELAAAVGDAAGVRAVLRGLWSMPHPEGISHLLWRPLLRAVKVDVDEIVGGSARAAAEARVDLATCLAVAAKLHRIGPVGAAWDLHLAAECTRLDGSPDPGAWAAAAQAWIAAGWLRERALALLGLATAHLHAGDDTQARLALEEVRAIADRLGAAPLTDAAATLARNAGLDTPGRARREPATALTNREQEVLGLIARGYSNNRIAAELFISPKTASVHVSNISAKLHANSRAEVVAIARRSNQLTTP